MFKGIAALKNNNSLKAQHFPFILMYLIAPLCKKEAELGKKHIYQINQILINLNCEGPEKKT